MRNIIIKPYMMPLVMLITLSATNLTANAIETDATPTPEDNEVAAASNSNFTIILCLPKSVLSQVTSNLLTLFKGYGFNIFSFPTNSKAQVNQYAAICRQAGVKGEMDFQYAKDGNTRPSDMSALVSNPYIAGWNLGENLSVRDFSATWSAKDSLLTDRGAWQYIYTGMMNITATPETMFAPGYPCYVKSYEMALEPDMLSFSLYPFSLDKNTGRYSLRKEYLDNLRELSDTSHKVPIWSEVLVPASTTLASLDGMIKVQAFSGLAYGSQGLRYKYDIGSAKSVEDGETWLEETIGNTRIETLLTNIMKSVNSDIRKMSSVFAGMRPEAVWRTDTLPPIQTMMPFPGIRTADGDKGVIVSRFSNNGVDYIFLVSMDLDSSQQVVVDYNTFYTEVTPLYFDGSIISGSKSKDESEAGIVSQSKKITFSLNPGSYCLLSWKKINELFPSN